jgi:plastocyanin
MKRLTLLLVAASVSISLTGCKPKAAVPTTTDGGLNHAIPLDPTTLGTLTGTIRLEGKAPTPLPIDITMDPACVTPGVHPVAQQYVVHDGKLANVYLYLKSGPPAAMNAAPTSTVPVVIDQKGCIYNPHVVALMAGGTVEFRNSDPTMHNIHTMPTTVGNDPISLSQGPHGAPKHKQFNAPETMIPLRCNLHPWMEAFINVSATPFYAISDANGRFEIQGLPAGDYTLGAVHEKLGEQTLQFTIKPKSTTQANLAFPMH